MKSRSGPAIYVIQVEGTLDASHWTTWFDGVSISTAGHDVTQLVGVMDQTGLHGLLAKIRNLGLILLSVQRPDGEAPGEV